MHDIPSVAQMMIDYGITVLISAIFLYVIVRVVNIVIDYFKSKVTAKKHDEGILLRESISTQIQNSISCFLEVHEGDRIQVVEFSNSVASIAYLPFKYMTCTYEVYNPSLQPMASKIDHISTSLFTSFFDHMYDTQYCIFDLSCHDKMVGGAMYDLMKSEGHNKCICSMLKSSVTSYKNVGYLVMFKSDISEHDCQEFQQLADGISALLSTVDKTVR